MNVVGTKINLPQGAFVFEQSANCSWAKVDDVTIGSESFYCYTTVKNNLVSIEDFLDTCLVDPKIIALVYDWESKTAYCKTGFNLNSTFDFAYSVGRTSFVVLSRVSSDYLPKINVRRLFPPQSRLKFVTVHEGNFVLEDGERFHAVGPNIYWLGYTEFNSYPTHDDIEKMFVVAENLSSTVIRSHTLGFSSGQTASLLENLNDLIAWDPIDFAFMMAGKYDIRLICPMSDNYWWANGNYGDYCVKRGIPKTEFWTNVTVRDDFKAYIRTWLNHVNQYTGIAIKDDPALFLIEIGNELGNIRPQPDGTWTTLPTFEWLKDMADFIKSEDANHLLLGGSDECLGSKATRDFLIESIDVFSSHFYDQNYSRLDQDASRAANSGKPYFVGEYSGLHFDDDWFHHVETNPDIKGSVFWNLYPLGTAHTDGQTLYYGDPNCEERLLKIANHHRRFRDLPIISSLL